MRERDRHNSCGITGSFLAVWIFSLSHATLSLASSAPGEVWRRYFDGGSSDYSCGVALDAYGNPCVTGDTRDPVSGIFSWQTIYYDSKGNTIFDRFLPGVGYEYTGEYEGGGIAVDKWGNIVVSGDVNEDIVTVKYDSSGNLIWQRLFDSGEDDYGYGIATDIQGNIYVCGASYVDDYGGFCCRVIKYDPSGNVVWSRAHSLRQDDFAYSIAVDSSGNIYMVGTGWADSYRLTIKCDPAGNIIWQQIYERDYLGDWGWGVAVDSSDYVYTIGCSNNGKNCDYRTIKYDPAGNILWDKVYDTGKTNEPYGIAIDKHDYIYVTGFSSSTSYGSDILTVKYDPAGEIIWTKVFDGGTYEYASGIQVDQWGDIYVTGSAYNSPRDNFVTLKYKQTDNWDPADDAGEGGNAITPTLTMQSHGPHVINEVDLVDWYRVSVTEPGIYYFTSTYTGGTATVGGIGDTKTELYLDPAGTILAASDDNGGEYYQFRLAFSATQSGTYYLKVSTVTEGVDWSGYLNYWYIVPGKLKSALAISPSPVVVGQIAKVTLTVTNSGGCEVTGVVPSIQISVGNTLVSYLGGPAPSSLASLGPGQSGTFTWTYSVSGAGLVGFSATASGTDQGMSETVRASSWCEIEAMFGAKLKSSLAVSPPEALLGDPISITLTATNTGGLEATNVIPALAPVLGGSLVSYLSGANPAGFVSLAPGESGTFTWTYSVTGAGIVTFSATATGKDEGTGGSIQASSSCQFEGLSMARLNSCLAVIPSSVFVGKPVLVTLTVTNTGNLAAEGVIGQLGFEAGSILVSPLFPLNPPGSVILNAGQMHVFSWSCTVSGAGMVVFSCTSSGTEAGTGNPLSCWSKAILVGKSLPPAPPPPSAKEKLGKGEFLVAPNVYDTSNPGIPIVFLVKGEPGGTVDLGVYDESGEYVGTLKLPLDGLGEGEVAWSGEPIGGKKLGSGIYWVSASGAGVSGRKRFVVKRGSGR